MNLIMLCLKYSKWNKSRDAYSEFFADSLAVIYLKDPKAISVALTDSRHNDRQARIVKLRGFLQRSR